MRGIQGIDPYLWREGIHRKGGREKRENDLEVEKMGMRELN